MRRESAQTSRSRDPYRPTGLTGDAARLWRDVTRTWELDPDALATLAEACRTMQELGEMEARLAGEGYTVPSAHGESTKPNPLVPMIRSHRQLLASLLKALGLEQDEAAPPPAGEEWRPRRRSPNRGR